MTRCVLARLARWPLLAALAVAGCAPAGRSGPAEGAQASPPTGADQSRTLSIVLRVEPNGAAEDVANLNRAGVVLFSAGLAATDAWEQPYPVLADAIPQLNTDSWLVFPDGRMEVTFHLRPGLTWHDGTALTANDFVFGRQVTLTKIEWGLSQPSVEQQLMEEIAAPDARTVLVRWRQPYSDAATSAVRPLPRHILEASLQQEEPAAFGSHPYWTTEYVGAGPYRLERWAPGAFLEGTAFGAFALGRPKIERVKLTWSGDPNVTVVRLLSGEAHIALDSALQFQQAATLKREWTGTSGGAILLSPTQLRYLQFQHRPQYVKPAALLDPRVRRGVAHAIDRQGLAEALLEGEGIIADSFLPPNVGYYPAIDGAVTKYAYDLRATERLMNEAGFVKGPDGLYTSPFGGRFSTDMRGIAEGQEGQETTILADYLRRAGFDAVLDLVPTAQRNLSNELKATFPGLTTNYNTLSRDSGMGKMITLRVAAPENRWTGTNRIGWINAEYDRLYDAWNRSLDRTQRNQYMVQMLKLVSEELPSFPLYFNFEVVAHVADLLGPEVAAPESTRHANIFQWRWR